MEAKHFEQICCLCGQTFTGHGNNPAPLGKTGEVCCDECNANRVVPARLARVARREAE